MTPENLVLFGQLLGIAFACGLNLYATVALLGLSARIGWLEALPIELQGLENPVLITSAAVLYVIEFIVDKVPYADSLWDTVHTFIRPTGAALLALGALGGMPVGVQVAGALLAGGVALVAHGTKAGLRLTVNTAPSLPLTFAISIAKDILAVSLAITTLRYHSAAVALGAAVIALVVLVGPQLWRAFLLGLRAVDARFRGFFGRAGWREPSDVPADLRALLDVETCGYGTPRAARAAVKGLRGVAAYRNGWLILAGDRAVFLYRFLFRPRRIILPSHRAAHVTRGLLADVLSVECDDFSYTIFLLKDGPAGDLAVADLRPASQSAF
jgi:hypothetical protein